MTAEQKRIAELEAAVLALEGEVENQKRHMEAYRRHWDDEKTLRQRLEQEEGEKLVEVLRRLRQMVAFLGNHPNSLLTLDAVLGAIEVFIDNHMPK